MDKKARTCTRQANVAEDYYAGKVSAEKYSEQVLKGRDFDHKRVKIESRAEKRTQGLIKRGLLE